MLPLLTGPDHKHVKARFIPPPPGESVFVLQRDILLANLRCFCVIVSEPEAHNSV